MPEDRWGFNEWAKTYDKDVERASQTNDWMFRDYDRILGKVVNYCELDIHRYSAVLDIGTGTGNLAQRFLMRGLQVIGIEPSEEMRKICQQKYPEIKVIAGDFLNIPLPVRSVDLIVSAYAFHHLTPTQKEESILDMKKVLKPKGRIVIADLMFQNTSQEQRIKQALSESGRDEILEEIEDEYFGYFDKLKEAFDREEFNTKGEQLTESVWILCACQ